MKTEKAKMLVGELYNAADPLLILERRRARDLCKLFNESQDAQQELHDQLIREFFAKWAKESGSSRRFIAITVQTSSLATRFTLTSTA